MYCWKCGHKNSEIAVFCEKCGAALCKPDDFAADVHKNEQRVEKEKLPQDHAEISEDSNSSDSKTENNSQTEKSETRNGSQTAHNIATDIKNVTHAYGDQVRQASFNTGSLKQKGFSFSFGFNQKMMVLATAIAIVASFLGFSSKEITSTSYLGGSYVAMGYWWLQPIWVIATVLGCYGLPLVGVATGGISLVIIFNNLITDAGHGFNIGVGAVLLVVGTALMVVFHLRAVMGRDGKDLLTRSDLDKMKHSAEQAFGNMSDIYRSATQNQNGGSQVVNNETTGNGVGKKQCPVCGSVQDNSAKFCGKCGYRFE